MLVSGYCSGAIVRTRPHLRTLDQELAVSCIAYLPKFILPRKATYCCSKGLSLRVAHERGRLDGKAKRVLMDLAGPSQAS